MLANSTLQNLLWEKNPTGIQDFTYQFTEAELSTLFQDVEDAWVAEWGNTDAERENAEAECDRHHCEYCES